MNLYAQNIVDHYKHPRNFGTLKKPNIHHEEANHACGDVIEVDLNVRGKNISEFRFNGSGCAVSMAAISILGQHVAGKSLDHILQLTKKDVQKFLGMSISARREKCALLGLLALQNAILTYRKKSTKKFSDLLGM